MLVIYPVLLLVITFWGAGFSGRGDTSKDHLDLTQIRMIRASACICVVLHHLTQQATGYGFSVKEPVTILNFCGILFTSLFFFFSGYGLLTKIRSPEGGEHGKASPDKSPGYLTGFLRKRLPAVLIPFWLANLLWLLLGHFVFGIRETWPEILKDLSGITLRNPNGWFIIEIVIFYILFYAIFRLIRNQDAALAILCLAVGLLILYSFRQGHDPEGSKAAWFHGEWWFNSTIMFPFGMLFARFRSRIVSFCSRHYPAVLGAAALLFAAAFCVSVYMVLCYGYYYPPNAIGSRNGKLLTLLAQMAACLTFTALILLLQMRITFHSAVLSYVGGISLELYLVHGFFVQRVFAGVRMNSFLRFAAVLLCSLLTASVLAPLDRLLIRKVKVLLNPVRIRNDTLESAIAAKRKEQRGRILRRILVCVMAAAAAAALLYTIGGTVILQKEYREERLALQDAAVGDRVFWGRIDTDGFGLTKERLSWIVTPVMLALCMMCLAGGTYNPFIYFRF